MKKCMMVMFALLYSLIGVAMLFAADAWTQKVDVGGIAREAPGVFSNGNKGYTGTGLDYHSAYNDVGKDNPGATPSAAPSVTLYAYFSGNGFYKYDGSTWTFLNLTGPTSMAASGVNLYAYFSGSGLYSYKGAAWT